jgi:hypothetical protein
MTFFLKIGSGIRKNTNITNFRPIVLLFYFVLLFIHEITQNVTKCSIIYNSLETIGIFYLPHIDMEHEESIGLVTRKMIFFADLHMIGLFMNN